MKHAACLALFAWLSGLFSYGADPNCRWLWDESNDPPRLELEVRWSSPVVTTGITARSGTQNLPVKFTLLDDLEGQQAAVLFLIDKSDPKRGRTIEAAKALTLQLIDRADARMQLAIYAFDSELVPVADWNRTRDEMPALLKPLKPTGLATELYRNVIECVRILERLPQKRRIIVILSDGRAEDTTYTIEQAITAAQNGRVSIYGVGFAETPQGTVHLQSLRRMAAETVGPFAEANISTRKIPQQFLDDFLPTVFSGLVATVDLQGVPLPEVTAEVLAKNLPPTTTTIPLRKVVPAVPPSPPTDPKVAEVAAKMAEMTKKVEDVAKQVEQVPVKIEESAKKAEGAAKQAEEKRKAEEIAAAAERARAANELAEQEAKAAAQKKFRLRLAIGLGLALVLGGGVFAFVRQRQGQVPPEPAPVFARLQVLDGDATEHRMTTTALRIGRGKDNDLTLANDSVSRHHAEISRARDGTFTITELNAGNGVLVNGKPVEKATLQNEDIIELGEVRIRFLTA